MRDSPVSREFRPTRLPTGVVRVVIATLAVGAPCLAQPVVQAVLNGASYSGSVAPGTWVAIYGSGFATSNATATVVPLPFQLGGVSVTFGGIYAPLLYISPTQINAIVPFELAAPQPPTIVRPSVVVTTPSGSSAPLTILLADDSPGLFTLNSAGTGKVLTFDASFNPASIAGTIPIVLYADGLGPTNPPASSASGGASAEPLNRVVDNLNVFVGDPQPPSFLLAWHLDSREYIN
jgi:uncharacterized protein (TIGR03437 family)